MTDRLVLDAGALIALERNDRRMWARLDAAAEATIDVVVPVGALAQVWRGTPNQARLSQALAKTRAGAFDAIARTVGVNGRRNEWRWVPELAPPPPRAGTGRRLDTPPIDGVR